MIKPIRFLSLLILFFLLSTYSPTYKNDNVSFIFPIKEIKIENNKAIDSKRLLNELEIINWGETPNFDMIINATSLGLKENDEIKLNYTDIGTNKLFYDVIYHASETNFLKKAKLNGNKIENGKMMFIFQAQLSFKIWHNILPRVKENLLN